MGYLYPHFKFARWQQTRAILPFRSTDRPTVKFFTVAPHGRSAGRPGLDPESNGSLTGRPPVDRADTESRALCRSTDPVDRGHFQRAELSGRSTGPPAQAGVHTCARRSTESVDRLLLGRLVRSTGRQPVQLIWDMKTRLFNFK